MASTDVFNVIFLGTGVSTAIPNIYHMVMDLDDDNLPMCKVCCDASSIPCSKNRRCNVSIAVSFSSVDDDGAPIKRCLIVDAGKTMREAFLNCMPKYGIRRVDAILLTHGHADAILGLDDVRDLQRATQVSVIDKNDPSVKHSGFKVESGPLKIVLHQETMDTLEGTFGYLTAKPTFLDEANGVLERRIALLDFQVIPQHHSFSCCGLPVTSFPVFHGGEYISLGFSFGKEGEFVYISDVKIIPEPTWAYLKAIPRIRILVLDCLAERGIFSHFGIDEALACADVLRPEVLYLTGMGCGMGLHDEVQQRLNTTRPNTFLAYDSLSLEGLLIR